MSEAAAVSRRTITVEQVDHIGVRVRDLDQALEFYGVLGFKLEVNMPRSSKSVHCAAQEGQLRRRCRY